MLKKFKFFPTRPVGKVSDNLKERNFYDKEGGFVKENNSRIVWPSIVIVIVFVALGMRLFKLQVSEGFVNLSLAEGNRIKDIPVPGARGKIIDEKGQVLASNQASYELITRITKVKDLDRVGGEIFETISLAKEEVKKKIEDQSGRGGFTVLKEDIPREEALLIKSHLPVYGEFEVTPTFVREYYEPSLAHVMGYVGKVSEEEQKNNPIAGINSFTGKSGIEKEYDQYLQGIPGIHKAEVNVKNQLVRFLSNEDPQIGKTLKLTVNKGLQSFAYEKLKEKTEELKTQGVVVALNPKNGAVLAMVSLPVYDNTKLSTGITQKELDEVFNNTSRPFLNRATSGVYPSGSTIKPFIASAALEEGIIDESTSFETPPYIEVGQWKFPDWKDHGVTDIKKAIAESNNIFFYALGGGWGPIKKGLGPERIKKGLEKFGFGHQTGIDLTSEEEGFLPTPEWKKRTTGENWYIGNTYNMAIGQGDLLVTPLQLANATAMIANGGKLFRPYLVSEILEGDKKVENIQEREKILSEGAVNPNTLRIVRDGMRQTVEFGSALSVFGEDFPIDVAAKTGTAQFGNEDKTHAWFTSFAPFEDPQIVVSVIIEAGGEGYQAAAPVARDILRWWSENR